MDTNFFIVSKGEIQEHVLLQKSSDGTLVDVSRLIAKQLRIVHILEERDKFV